MIIFGHRVRNIWSLKLINIISENVLIESLKKNQETAENWHSFEDEILEEFKFDEFWIILGHNHFSTNGNFVHQIKGTALGTHAAVIYENLICGYLEITLFNKLREIFSYDIVEFFLKNYFRFLDDVNTVGKKVMTFHHYGN